MPGLIQQEQVAGSIPKKIVLSLVGSFLLKALHKRKEILKGMCLCQMRLLVIVFGFFCLMISHAEEHVNIPLAVGFRTASSKIPS